jgi:DNA replication protein DnaC
MCNGSGQIALKDGTFIPCGCGRLNKAEELFQISSAPKNYMTFINDLEFNPLIQNTKKKEMINRKLAAGQITKEQAADLSAQTFAPLKSVLSQFDDGAKGNPIKRFIKEGYKLYFYGNPRTGKTAAALALGMQAGMRNVKFYYLSFHTLHKLIQYNFYNEEANKVSEEMKRLEECDVLIMDDLGKEYESLNLTKNSDADRDLLKKMLQLVEATIRDKKRLLIITSNLKPEEAEEFYSKANPTLWAVLVENNFLSYHFREQIGFKVKDDAFDELL